MFEDETVPFTIIKENNSGTFDTYKWTKTLPSQEKLIYLIEDITILQEPTETLTLSVTLSHERKPGSGCTEICQIQCFHCAQKADAQRGYIHCTFCSNKYSYKHVPNTICLSKKDIISCDLSIDFHNYLHEFSNSYSYEVVCKISHENKPDDYLFRCVESRSKKALVFKKCEVSTPCDDTFNFSSSTLYFGIRRLSNYCKNQTRISELLRVISTFQSMDDNSDNKVFLQARDGQIAAHKSILSQNSDVFRAMFAHDTREKRYGVVEILDVGIEIIKKMVDYLCTRKLGNITRMTEDLFKVAHRYQIHELCRRCEEYYIFSVQPNNDNIVEILQLANLYELKGLKNSAEKFVGGHEKALTTLSCYQKYLCESINIGNATNTLISADKFKMKEVKTCALEFIKHNFDKMVNCEDFLKLFDSNSRLMKEVYISTFHKKV